MNVSSLQPTHRKRFYCLCSADTPLYTDQAPRMLVVPVGKYTLHIISNTYTSDEVEFRIMAGVRGWGWQLCICRVLCIRAIYVCTVLSELTPRVRTLWWACVCAVIRCSPDYCKRPWCGVYMLSSSTWHECFTVYIVNINLMKDVYLLMMSELDTQTPHYGHLQ